MAAKKIPQRMCVGCRSMKEKRELIRVIRTEDSAALDPTGKQPGRGAYICPSTECLHKAQKSRGLERALNVHISKEVYEQLHEALNHAAE